MTKIPYMDPEQLTPDIFDKMNTSFGEHSTHPSMIVGVAMRKGCIELVIDLVSLSDTKQDALLDLQPPKNPFPDPSVWLQHLHVLPPPGTHVLTQACGRFVDKVDSLLFFISQSGVFKKFRAEAVCAESETLQQNFIAANL